MAAFQEVEVSAGRPGFGVFLGVGAMAMAVVTFSLRFGIFWAGPRGKIGWRPALAYGAVAFALIDILIAFG